ncbi:MAG: PAS domain S-box protein [Deltaproteobacteria bacterium]|nr:PAS domain S-box protein [Deltaproteobacteria bacterium]
MESGSENGSKGILEEGQTISLERSRVLLRVTGTVLEETSPHGLLQRAAEAALELTGARVGAAGYGCEDGLFRVQATTGNGEAPPGPPEETVQEEMQAAYRELLQGVPSIRLPDAGLAARGSGHGSESFQGPAAGCLAAGLRGPGSEAAGVIMVMDKRDGEFTEEEEVCLRQLADISSLAMNHIEARALADSRAVAVEEKGGILQAVTGQKQAEAALKTAWDDLESEVWRRTSELRTAKQNLEQEVREHRRTADRLRESNEVLESIFANTHLLMAYMDRNFDFIRVNEAYAAAANKTVDFFTGKNHFDLYPHEENEALFRRVLETGEPYAVTAKPFDHPHQPDRGTTYWDWSLQPVWDDRGGVSGVLLGLMDVTDRVKAEQERSEGERKFRLLAETIEDVFWMSKPGITDMLYVSPAYEKVWGRSVESLYAVPRSFIDAVHPEDRPRVVEEIKRHAMGKWDLEYRIVRPDGELRWVRDRGFPLRDGQGSTIGMCGTASDITRLKEAEEAIRKSEQRARELQERSLDGFARTDMESRFIEVNQAFEALVGYSESELREMTVRDITPNQWLHKELGMAEQLRREGHTPLYEKEFQRKDGTLVSVELRVHVSRDAEGTPREMWAFVRDITERKQTEIELLENMKKLEQSNRDLGDFAYVTSHDLQEPLRKIQTFGDRLGTKYADRLDDRGRDYLDRMVSAATRMRSLIEALLHYSRVSTRQQPFSEVELDEVAREALFNLEDLIDRSNGAVAVSGLPRVEGDPHQLLQLMQNLIGNALKFQRPGVPPSIRIDQRKLPRKKGARERCELRFEDNGIGIEERYMEQIFKPFHRLHGRGEYEGAGMGLAICRKIVERHGGDIRVESEEGQGSVFIVTLPLKQPPAGKSA